MRGLSILVRKELVESWRTYRLPVVAGLFAFVGLSSPLLARFLPEIVKAAAGDAFSSIAVPTPTAADAVLQVQKNLGQFGALAAIILAMGSVATETERGTAAFILSRPVGRGAFLAAKAASIGLVLAISVTLAIVLGWIYTSVLFAPPPIDGWVALALLSWLYLCAWAALTFLASVVTGSAAAAAGIGFVVWLLLSIVAALPAVERWTPAGLNPPATALATGTASIGSLGAELWIPVIATVALIALALVASFAAFRRREL